ncbi:hypothetical protein T12_6099 [Trichinella patagoniensis]|uniref:Uncharacterized protein n=1 Tax=Trichinella patagoniensis TaxID=990121 RepID=A0A0V0ZIN1_9BILA|nr:hypothetical protein T12_6099 [Trichinella patagoniensis]
MGVVFIFAKRILRLNSVLIVKHNTVVTISLKHISNSFYRSIKIVTSLYYFLLVRNWIFSNEWN